MSELLDIKESWQPRRIEYCDLDILWNQRPLEHFKTWFPNHKLIAVKEPGYSYTQIDSQLNSPEWQVELGSSLIIDCIDKDWQEKILNIVLNNTEKWVILINDTYRETKSFRRLIPTLE